MLLHSMGQESIQPQSGVAALRPQQTVPVVPLASSRFTAICKSQYALRRRPPYHIAQWQGCACDDVK